MRLHARSLKWQAVLVAVGALLLSHIISVTVYHFDRREAIAENETFDFAERAAAYASLAGRFPPEERMQILSALRRRTTQMELGAPIALEDCPQSDLAGEVAAMLEGSLPAGFASAVCIERWAFNSAPFAAQTRATAAAPLVSLGFRFPDGQTLLVAAPLAEPPSFFADVALLYIVTATLIVGAAAYWLIHRVTSPLRRFAEKASEVGKNLDVPPLEEEGPEEVAAAVRAFNRMQARLQRLIGGRTEMLAAISHDLRTPVTRLKLRVEMMEDAEQRKKLLPVLDDMEAMIAAVLAFIRGAAPREQPRAVDVAALVDSLCDDLAEIGAPAVCHVPQRPVVLQCRPLSLKRCLQNLIDNAVKYGGGAEVRVEEGEDEVIVRVLDHGPGVPQDQLEAVFRPFYRLESSRSRETGGIGLGLSIAATIAHAHGGSIALANRPSGGLDATVRLPK